MHIIYLLIIALLSSCEQSQQPAPVAESHWLDLSHEKKHQVTTGETLFAIAFRYEKDYLALAKLNHINAPYDIHIGQTIKLQPEQKKLNQYTKKPTIIAKIPNKLLPQLPQTINQWNWPVHGKIIKHFNPNIGNKGIEIATEHGVNVIASAPGTVAYAGSGLLAYGKLIIIKHNNNFLSAYANNSKILIHEGETIHANQIIALTGKLDAIHNGLHFEIRKNGKPLNPLQFIH